MTRSIMTTIRQLETAPNALHAAIEERRREKSSTTDTSTRA